MLYGQPWMKNVVSLIFKNLNLYNNVVPLYITVTHEYSVSIP